MEESVLSMALWPALWSSGMVCQEPRAGGRDWGDWWDWEEGWGQD